MRKLIHPWKRERSHQPVRFFIGLVVALALVLTAFEWRAAVSPHTPWVAGHEEDRWVVEVLPAVTVKQPETTPRRAAPRQAAAGGPVVPVVFTEPTPDGPDPGDAPDAGPITTAAPVDSGTAAPVRPFVMVKETLPCHRDCQLLEEGLRDACTAERLHRHVASHLELPRGMYREVHTTVTFTVEADGRVGRVVCAPKVPVEVEGAIARTLRSMPPLAPGRQGEMAVPVHYQIALRLRRQ